MPLAGSGLTVKGAQLALVTGLCPVAAARYLMLFTTAPTTDAMTMAELNAGTFEADNVYSGYTRQKIVWDAAGSNDPAEIRNTGTVAFTQDSIAAPVPIRFVGLTSEAVAGLGGDWLAYWEVPAGGFTPAPTVPFTVRFQADALALRIL